MATIAEKSRSKEIIDRMQSIIDAAPSVPLAQGKISIYRDELQALLNELAIQIDTELKTYHEVNDRRGKIISEAKQAAEKIIHDAEFSASRMRVNKSATGVAPLDVTRLNQEELDSLSTANEIYAASLIYTDEMMTEVSNMITTAYSNIRSDYEAVLGVLEDKMNTINNNRQELMMGLQEMDASERSQQIMEIGQLLSNELYMSRMRAKMNSDEYEDGSVQLSLEFVEEQEEKARIANEQAMRAQRALEQMTAERDALKETVMKMKNDGMAATLRDTKNSPAVSKTSTTGVEEVVSPQSAAPIVEKTVEPSQPTFVKMEEAPLPEPVKPSEEDEEYEVVYVSEDELEDGEEYEVEYVDDEEYEKIMNQIHPETADHKKEEKPESETLSEPEEEIPLIPTFKRAEKIATISSEQLGNLSKGKMTSAEKNGDKGFIGRAVLEKEKAQLNDTVTVHDPSDEKLTIDKKKPEKDADIKTDEDGKEYVQATMKFDDDFEIMEF